MRARAPAARGRRAQTDIMQLVGVDTEDDREHWLDADPGVQEEPAVEDI